MVPYLNWQEIALWVEKIRPELIGLFVDRIIVPQRNYFPEGYFKGEWLFRLTGRKQDCVLIVSIRPRRPYMTWSKGKGPAAASEATRSSFDLHLSKHLRGAKLMEIEALPRERIVIIWFSSSGERSDERLGLVVTLIPAAPEAFLISSHADSDYSWRILARSRNLKTEATEITYFRAPNNSTAPLDLPVRTEFLTNPDTYYHVIEKNLRDEAFDLRLKNVERVLTKSIKQATEGLKQSQAAVREGQLEKDWQKWADLLKGTLGQMEDPKNLSNSSGKNVLEITDPATEETYLIPIDPQLSLIEQAQKFYQKAKKKLRRLSEGQTRVEQFQETCMYLRETLESLVHVKDWPGLEKLEMRAGLGSQGTSEGNGLSIANGRSKKNNFKPWLGKTFTSADGLLIWVGRSKEENLQLTFKQARGNDLWMHLRGRPGAHAVVPLQPGKSAPLETLLDAAHLTIHYSGGSNWGKTEVDYTFKKYVKRIKDSSEASYTNNKTLFIQVDQKRIKRLLGQGTPQK